MRRSAAATLLEQAAALARIGNVEALLGVARGLLTPGAEVVPLMVAKAGRRP